MGETQRARETEAERERGRESEKESEKERESARARRRREKRERKEDIPSDSEFLEMRRFGQWIAAVNRFEQYRCSFGSTDVSWVNV